MLEGIVPIIAATFNDAGDVDYQSLRALIRHMARIGCDGATLFGIAGEYYKLSDQEQLDMLRVTADECKQCSLPLLASITQHSTNAAIARAQIAQAEGADVLMLLPPFFLKPSGNELYDHMKLVAQSVSIPVMVQYAPEQTGVSIAPTVFKKLSDEVENVLYYKVECKPAGPYITNLLDLLGDRVKVFAGNAGYQMIETFLRGAVGAMPGCSMSEIYIKIYRLYQEGKLKDAVSLHSKLLPILNHIRQNVEMIIAYEKKILFKRGIIGSDYCRTPGFRGDPVMDSLFEMYYQEIESLLQ